MLAIALIIVTVVAIAHGSSRIPYADVARILLNYVGIPLDDSIARPQITIVQQVRLPRIFVAMFVGAGLSVSGAVMQGIFRNGLADPGILGVSAGGSLGAVIAFTTGMALNGLWVVPIFAFVGAITAALVVYLLALEQGRANTTSLLLAGIALNAFISAIVSMQLLLTEDIGQAQAIITWLIGSLAGKGWRHVIVIAPPILLCITFIYSYSRDLNLFLLGEETAQGLGTNVPRTRFILLALAALATGLAVSMAGVIGFVGLVVPHVLRLIIGPDHRVLIPASMLGGAVFLVLADTITRIVIPNVELPVGIVTSLIGGPFFLYLLWRQRKTVRSL